MCTCLCIHVYVAMYPHERGQWTRINIQNLVMSYIHMAMHMAVFPPAHGRVSTCMCWYIHVQNLVMHYGPLRRILWRASGHSTEFILLCTLATAQNFVTHYGVTAQISFSAIHDPGSNELHFKGCPNLEWIRQGKNGTFVNSTTEGHHCLKFFLD